MGCESRVKKYTATMSLNAFLSTADRQLSVAHQVSCADLVQLYFDYVHDQFHTLSHPPSFLEDMNRGQTPWVLLLIQRIL